MDQSLPCDAPFLGGVFQVLPLGGHLEVDLNQFFFNFDPLGELVRLNHAKAARANNFVQVGLGARLLEVEVAKICTTPAREHDLEVNQNR